MRSRWARRVPNEAEFVVMGSLAARRFVGGGNARQDRVLTVMCLVGEALSFMAGPMALT